MIRKFGTDTALLMIDVQEGVDVLKHWGGAEGRRNNPEAETHIGKLLAAWRAAELPGCRAAELPSCWSAASTSAWISPLNTTSPPETYPLTATRVVFKISSPDVILNNPITNRLAEKLFFGARNASLNN